LCGSLCWTQVDGALEVSCWGQESHQAAAWRPLPHMCNIGAAGWWYHMISYLFLRLNWFIWNYFILYVVGFCMFLWISAAETIHAGHFLEGPLISWFWYVLIHFDSMARWLLAIHDLLKQARPDSLKGQQLAPGSECVWCDACDACDAEVSWRVMPKNYQPPNLHVLPRNMAHLYIYIYIQYTHMIYHWFPY
jgi:hypothetical protein